MKESQADLREAMKKLELPPAPASLHAGLESLASRQTSKLPPSRFLLAAVGVIVAIGIIVSPRLLPSLAGPGGVGGIGSQPGAAGSRGLNAPESYSVAGLLAARASGKINADSVLVHGYWSVQLVPLSCAAPTSQPGDLELYCHDGQWGLTDQLEPILQIVQGSFVPARGPRISPFVPRSLQSTLLGDGVGPSELIPAELRGHFDDPLSKACRPEAQVACRDRFVVDEVVSFDLKNGLMPEATAAPTPFPFDSPPAPLFETIDCAGDVPYSFVGWIKSSELGLNRSLPEVVYAAVTRDVVLVGDWFKDPAGSGQRFRTWARTVCYAKDEASHGVTVTWIPGTAYNEWEDGHTTQLEP